MYDVPYTYIHTYIYNIHTYNPSDKGHSRTYSLSLARKLKDSSYNVSKINDPIAIGAILILSSVRGGLAYIHTVEEMDGPNVASRSPSPSPSLSHYIALLLATSPTSHTPMQSVSSLSVYPGWHVHMNPPSVLLQMLPPTSSEEQLCASVKHSSISILYVYM